MEFKNKNPLVSIIMNCYNGEKFLNESIKSVLNQSYKNWELIFWDNMSSDNSSKIIKKIDDSRIKYYLSNKFEKLYKARNLALEKASGKFICFLDTDDLWETTFIEKNLNKISKLNSSIIYSKYFIKNEVSDKKYISYSKDLPSGFITQKLLKRYLVGISAVFLKKDIFDENKFDPNYQIIGDFDLFLKLSLTHKFYAIQEPLLTYRHHPNNFTNKNLKMYVNELKYWIENNQNLYKKKYNLNYLKIYIFKLRIKKFLKILRK